MPITLSNGTRSVTLYEDDMPEHIPLGGVLTGRKEQLGDGSNIFSITGETLNAVTLTGTVLYTDKNGTTPIQKMQALDAIRLDRKPITVTGIPGPIIFEGLTYTIEKNNQCAYSILLFRETLGGFTNAATSTPTVAEQARFHGNNLSRHAASTSPKTTATINTALNAFSNIPAYSVKSPTK